MSVLDLKSKHKYITVLVQSFDAEAELQVDYDSKGKKLFDSICSSLGIRETWYFGLSYESTLGHRKWLKMNKKLNDVNFKNSLSNGVIKMFLSAKFYPEDVGDELIQEYTQHLFYLQAKEQVMKDSIYAPAEMCIMLASFAAQAKVIEKIKF